MEPGKGPFDLKWSRLQFPFRLAYAVTINKSQGQTLARVGVWMLKPCFGAGQFYVAFSRVGSPENIVACVPRDPTTNTLITRNVVYSEVFGAQGAQWFNR